MYCSACGGKTEKRWVEQEERERDVCSSCGHIEYVNPKIVAGTLPVTEGGVWLVRRGIEPRYGYWTHPAGFMELGETVEQGAARETLEELGTEVDIGKLVGVYSRSALSTVHIVYTATPLGSPCGGKETLEFAQFSRDTIPWDDLAFWSSHRALRDWLNSVETSEGWTGSRL